MRIHLKVLQLYLLLKIFEIYFYLQGITQQFIIYLFRILDKYTFEDIQMDLVKWEM